MGDSEKLEPPCAMLVKPHGHMVVSGARMQNTTVGVL
jgi:hypothetical protein